MTLQTIDFVIIALYFVATLVLGIWASKRGSRDVDSYVLGGRSMPWYVLGVSDASGMFDITGTMWLVYILFVYGLKSIWLPWLWPTFNQIFLMMFLSAWLRRSNVMTGAEWIATRFGQGRGANLAHISVVVFALVNVVGMLAYAFKGIGKFAVVMLPWRFTGETQGIFSDENVYAMIILGLTSIYAIKGGMVSVVVTEVMQFFILTFTAITIGIIAMYKVSPEMIHAAVPAGWSNPWFGLRLDMDWSTIFAKVDDVIKEDGNELFGIVFGMMVFKGVLASLAGPAPNYDMQRILATRNPREASLMNGFVNVVLMFPRYLMITGLTVLALAFCMTDLQSMEKPDFEKLLPIVLTKSVPAGVVGILLAGLLAALMSNFAATINAAPAYIVNDIYKRFMNPSAPVQKLVNLSRMWALIILAVGIVFGLLTTRITDVMMWIVGALYGGYVMANVLKWYWWRFNGYGYFWGMITGIGAAMLVPEAAALVFDTKVNTLFLFPVIFAISTAGSIIGALSHPPEDTELLKKFYRTVRPWGMWAPIRDQVVAEDPTFVPNRRFGHDMVNVVIGIIWQLCLVSSAIFLILRDWPWFIGVAVTLVITSVLIKFRWYDKLEPADAKS